MATRTRMFVVAFAALVSTAALVVSAQAGSAPSSSGLGPSLATASGTCSRGEILTDFRSSPATRHVLARIVSTAPLMRIDGTNDFTTTGGADTTWNDVGEVSAGEPFEIRANCYKGIGSMTVDLFEVPSAPATFAGALTRGVQTDATAHLVTRADRAGHYVANLTRAQGSVELEKEQYSEHPKTFSSSGQYDLGNAEAGDLVDVFLTALDGPQSNWQIEVKREA